MRPVVVASDWRQAEPPRRPNHRPATRSSFIYGPLYASSPVVFVAEVRWSRDSKRREMVVEDVGNLELFY